VGKGDQVYTSEDGSCPRISDLNTTEDTTITKQDSDPCFRDSTVFNPGRVTGIHPKDNRKRFYPLRMQWSNRVNLKIGPQTYKAHHGEVNIAGIELQVDLLVNSILTVLVVVLTHLGSHFTVTGRSLNQTDLFGHKLLYLYHWDILHSNREWHHQPWLVIPDSQSEYFHQSRHQSGWVGGVVSQANQSFAIQAGLDDFEHQDRRRRPISPSNLSHHSFRSSLVLFQLYLLNYPIMPLPHK